MTKLPNALVQLEQKMTKPLLYDPNKFYRVQLARSVEYPPGSRRMINPAPIRIVNGKPKEIGAVRLRGDVCAQLDSDITAAYEVTAG